MDCFQLASIEPWSQTYGGELKSAIGGKNPANIHNLEPTAEKRVGENNRWEVQAVIEWLQKTLGGSHRCQKVCNQILKPVSCLNPLDIQF